MQEKTRDTICDCPYTYAGGQCINSLDNDCKNCPVYKDWYGQFNQLL